MKRSTVGLLVGAGVGAVLAWVFRGRILGNTYDRYIILKTKNGRCDIDSQPADVTLSSFRDDKIRWNISNPDPGGCPGRHEVCIGNWRLNGVPTNPPVRNAQGLCRPVDFGGPDKQILANIDRNAECGEYTYDVLIDDRVAVDPIVKLIL
jgi:hypothetical protein